MSYAHYFVKNFKLKEVINLFCYKFQNTAIFYQLKKKNLCSFVGYLFNNCFEAIFIKIV